MRRLLGPAPLALVRNRPRSLRVTGNRKVCSDCSRCRSHGVGAICRPACSGCLLYFCPWRGRRDEPSVHARDRERPCVAKDRHPSLSVPIHGGRLEASGSTRPCTSYGSCRRADRYQARAPKDPDRRREVIWWTHDVAGAAAAPLPKVRGLAFGAFRCTRRTGPPPRAPTISPRSTYRCSFIQGDRDALADRRLLLPWFKVSAAAPFFRRSKVPIILSTSSRGRDVRTNKPWMTCSTGSPAGSWELSTAIGRRSLMSWRRRCSWSRQHRPDAPCPRSRRSIGMSCECRRLACRRRRAASGGRGCAHQPARGW